MKKTLVDVMLVGALALGSSGCDNDDGLLVENSKTYYKTHGKIDRDRFRNKVLAQTQKWYLTKHISGEILSIDEDWFPVGGDITTKFPYETIRIKDVGGNIKRLLIPQLTSYAVGDKIEGKYKILPNGEIDFNSILEEFTIINHPGPYAINYYDAFPLQKGKVKAEGILEY